VTRGTATRFIVNDDPYAAMVRLKALTDGR